MSNFSQYFPSTSSGGGSGGTPINGYTPFLVTGTGNPLGYDATTGLYTHPDGTFWIETGNTISTTLSTYPDANVYRSSTTPGGHLIDGTKSLIPLTSIEYNETSDVIWMSSTNPQGIGQTISTYFYNNNATSTGYQTLTNLWVAAGVNGVAASGATSNGLLMTNPSSGNITLTEYTQAGATTGTTYNIATDATDITYDSVDDTYWILDGATETVYHYNNNFTTQITSFSVAGTGAVTNLSFIASNSDGLWLTPANQNPSNYFVNNENIYSFTKVGVYGNFTIPITNIGGAITATDKYNNIYIDRVNQSIFTAYDVTNAFGDGTARTDTDSTQPLFVRLK